MDKITLHSYSLGVLSYSRNFSDCNKNNYKIIITYILRLHTNSVHKLADSLPLQRNLLPSIM